MARRTSDTPNPNFTADGREALRKSLAAAGERPAIDAPPANKIKYAVPFAEEMGTQIASGLDKALKGIAATTKRDAGSARGRKQLDVNFSTPASGLALGISLKSVHIRDVGSGHKYGHNKKRNTEELLVEAAEYHRRQPYAVIIGVLFLPSDSCTDGKLHNPSSFGSWVRHLRPHIGRLKPEDDISLLEKIYIGLYEPDGSDLRFFDVESNPPKNARPRETLSFAEFLKAAYDEYAKRNKTHFVWADGVEDDLPLDAPEDPDESS